MPVGYCALRLLLKSYISEGLRKDESQFLSAPSAQLIEALRKRGVPDAILEEAAKELLAA